ncbi:response regulator [Caldibacillus lycopersici]|uniref:Response regulator n=1 Tax=Perspicuibacillus lycopersici TaxID=1325689 RepID=A0AAE3IQS6_9BACI|nr:response regulator [Perspicuibacillus lycopersici]MCU9612712.1 response regulator [Perspicuibacillus lycopersici]
MYRLLIADDEAIEREGLELLIERFFPNTFQIYHAINGRAALEKVDQYNPDVILMDIKMPGIDGLEAAKQIREGNSRVKILLITAYDYFNYAKEAVSIGVKHYILKPMKREQVVNILENLVRELDEEREKRHKDLELKEKLSELLPIAETEAAIMLTINYVNELDFQRLTTLMDFPMNRGYALIVSFEELDGKQSQIYDKRMIYDEIKNRIKSMHSCLVGPIIGARMTIFLRDSEHVKDNRTEAIELGNKLRTFVKDRFQQNIVIGIGTIRDGFDGLRRSYQEAALAVSEKNAFADVRHVSDIHLAPKSKMFRLEEEQQLFEALSNMDISLALHRFDDMFNQLLIHVDHELEASQQAVQNLLDTITHHCLQYDIILDAVPSTKNTKNISQIRQLMVQHIYSIVEAVKQVKGNKMAMTIERAKEYILQNYKQDISMEQVAEYVNLSSYYFSKMFKSESNQTFTEYLTNIRIRQAKELIGNVDYSLKEICFEVGYNDPNYFSRVFKRVTGMTPTEYRQQLFVS